MTIQKLFESLTHLNLLKNNSKNYSKIIKLFSQEATTHNFEQVSKLLLTIQKGKK